MSHFRLSWLPEFASKIGRARRRLSRREGEAVNRRPRRLIIDPLEQRQMLSVAPANLTDVLVNNPISAANPGGDSQTTLAGQSVAADHDGDFVVVWTRYDAMLDEYGDPVIDPDTGEAMTDANIYARYLTDEVQRIALPSGVLTDTLPSAYGRFSLTYGGYEIQKLTISATYEPYAFSQENISGTIQLKWGTATTDWAYDETDPLTDLTTSLEDTLNTLIGVPDGVMVEATNPHEFLIHFNSAALAGNQAQIAAKFDTSAFYQGFLPAARMSTVRQPTAIGVDKFGNPSIPIHPTDPTQTAQAIEAAFLATSQTLPIGPVEFPVPDDVPPEGPYDFGPQEMRTALPRVSVTSVSTPDDPNGLRHFDITFTDQTSTESLGGPTPVMTTRYGADGGKQDQPLLVISAVRNEAGVDITSTLDVTPVVTIKEPSPEFRVNPEEPYDPFAIGLGKYNQTNPAVAMDADGEFVIVWQSEVPDAMNYGTMTDIFARRFTPTGVVADPTTVPDLIVPGVRALASPEMRATQVLTFTPAGPGTLSGPFKLKVGSKTTASIAFNSANRQATATAIQDALVAIGYQGVVVMPTSTVAPYTFEVVFGGASSGMAVPMIEYVADAAQPLAATFGAVDRSGDLYTFRVNQFTTNAQFTPSVGMDSLGNFVIAWSGQGQPISFFNGVMAARFDHHGKRIPNDWLVNTEDTEEHTDPFVAVSRDGHFLVTWVRDGDVQAEVYDVDGTVLREQFTVSPGFEPTAAWDAANNYIIGWTQEVDADNIGITSTGVFAIEYPLEGTTDNGTITYSPIRDTFRANSASFDPTSAPFWPLAQYGGQVALDADGDLTITYEGFGPDVSQNTQVASRFFTAEMSKPENADLLKYFPASSSLPYFDLNGFASYFITGDVDSVINDVLSRAPERMIADEFVATTTVYSPTTSLMSPVTSTDTVLKVVSVADFPATAPFTIQVGTEILRVTAIDSLANEWTVERGVDGTAAAAHGMADLVTLPSTTLSAAATAAGTTLTLTSLAGFPTTAPFKIHVGTETMQVTAINTVTKQWTVVRGIDGTTAASHTVSEAVSFTDQAMTAADTILKVTSAASFPDFDSLLAGEFKVQVGAEIMEVTAVDPVTNEWTVVRGVDGTTAAVHNYGDVVTFRYSPTPAIPATTLAGLGASSFATTLTVASSAGFPAMGSFEIAVDQEIMRVDFAIGNTWTVTRGLYGTTAAAHSVGATVREYDAELPLSSENIGRLGRLRAILDNVAGLLRGEANGILYSQWDADPTLGVQNILWSDNIANATRDGRNQQVLIAIDPATVGGTFTLRLYHPEVPGFEDVVITPVVEDDVLNRFDTADAIAEGLAAAVRVGINWPTDTFEGPISARYVTPAEIEARQDTYWDTTFDPVDYVVYEVTFQGEVHDTPMMVYLQANDLTLAPIAEVQTLTFTPTPASLANGSGIFGLALGAENTTADLTIDYGNPAALAGALATAIQGLAGVNDGVTVVFDAANSTPNSFSYTITFGGDLAGADQPPVQQGTAVYVPPAAPPDLTYGGTISSAEVVKGSEPAANPTIVRDQIEGDEGTQQTAASIGMQPDGDFVIVWTQYDRYTDGEVSNQNIYFRTFNEHTDTAGPMVTDVLAPNGTALEDGDTVAGPLTHLVVTFDENMAYFDAATLDAALARRDALIANGQSIPEDLRKILDSVTNPDNYQLSKGSQVLTNMIVSVDFGLSKAAQLAATSTDLSAIASNKYEAVLTFAEPLPAAVYTLSVLAPVDPSTASPNGESGMRDRAGNPLGRNGFEPSGDGFSRQFVVKVAPVLGPTDETDGTRVTREVDEGGWTDLEDHNATATNSKGDYVVVWTKSIGGLDRVMMRQFNADGSPRGAAVEVDGGLQPGINQRYGNVAMTSDGDFLVTWTAFDASGNADIFARRFNANGTPRTDGPAGKNPFRVNQYTTNQQQWPDAAVDAQGNFIVTWSSYGQEDNNQLGNGWGIYARRYDSFGQPLAPEFQANVTIGGDQRHSAVAMDSQGGFAIAWESERNGRSDIVARAFWPTGAPQVDMKSGQGPLYGEFIVNDVPPAGGAAGTGTGSLPGNRTHPDVAMDPNGQTYVVTWTGPDISGTGVYMKQFARRADVHDSFRDVYSARIAAPGEPIHAPGDCSFLVPLNPNNDGNPQVVAAGTIEDIKVSLDLEHPEVSQLVIYLIRADAPIVGLAHPGTNTDPVAMFDDFSLADIPAGITYQEVLLVNQRPDDDVVVTGLESVIFDDQAAEAIANAAPVNGIFTGSYAPEGNLSSLQGQDITGYYYLWINDLRNGGGEDGYLTQWAIDISRAEQSSGNDTLVNTTTNGNQYDSAIAMDHLGNFIIAWSGRGEQDGQRDTSGSGGVYYQRFDAGGTPLTAGSLYATEMRANTNVSGSQVLPSVAMDAGGQFVITYYDGQSTTAPTNSIRSFVSRNNDVFNTLVNPLADPSTNAGAPQVAEAFQTDGTRLLDGSVLPVGLESLVFAFDQQMSTVSDDDNPTEPGVNSILNVENWSLSRNGATMYGNVVNSVKFGLGEAPNQLVANNSLAEKYLARVYFDGNGLASGIQALPAGDYVLTFSDVMAGGSASYAGSFLDGDFDGRPGGTFTFHFTIPGPALDAERLVTDENPRFEATPTTPAGMGFAREETTRSVAVDHSGNFAVAWTSYGEDDPSDSQGAGVFLRLYGRDDKPLTASIPVNTTTAGHQRNAAVAMNAVGDLIVVWESQGQDPDGSWSIYARRFNSMGVPQGGEFRVNTNTANDQCKPAVASDDFGNFVVVWASKGQAFSYFNEVRGQLYNYAGNRVGNEFLVNSKNLPGTAAPPNGDFVGATEVNPAVAMRGRVTDDTDLAFVVTWDQIVNQGNGATTDTVVVARLFNRLGQPLTNNGGTVNSEYDPATDAPADDALDTEFQVNVDGEALRDPEIGNDPGPDGGTDIKRRARNSKVAIDDQGKFIVAWEAYRDLDSLESTSADSYGIYYQRFNPDGSWDMTQDHQANEVIQLDEDTPPESQIAINNDFFARDQVNPSVAMDADGDYRIVWNGNGAEPHPLDPINQPATNHDETGVWIRSFDAKDEDDVSEAVSVQTRVNLTSAGIQQFPSIAMTPDGDAIVVWSGNGVGDRHGIFFRRYKEATDTAGPMAVYLLSPSGERINPQTQILASMSTLTVVFDEAMLEAGDVDRTSPQYNGIVTNPLNYQLIQNGSVITNAITSVQYGLNPLTNRYEAVLTIDGNGNLPGAAPLADGQYELVVLNALRDKAGNPLGSNGTVPNGAAFRQSFTVMAPLPTETRVNTDPAGNQQFIPPGTPEGHEANPRTVAADANGDYVVVWTSDAVARTGLWAKMYDATRTPETTAGIVGTAQKVTYTEKMVINPTTLLPWLFNEILVTSDPTATEAAVARDADGDFVVTWAQRSNDAVRSWDVYARRYNALGQPLGDAFLVNSETDDVQRCPTVAADADGDFVIAWQSLNQDGSGYGIYAQRFDTAGHFVGGTDETQVLNFIGNPKGSFVLRWEDAVGPVKTTAPIVIPAGGGTLAALAQLRTELAKLGAEVEVQAVSNTQIAIRFVGTSGSRNVASLVVQNLLVTGDAGARITSGTGADGSSGEFLINTTTTNDQIHPSVGMSAAGTFVVSWTAFGQDGDGPSESNIYAKVLPSNDVFRPSSEYAGGGTLDPRFTYVPRVVSTDDPSNHIITGTDGLGSVVQVLLPGGWGSGSLLVGGNFVLTAAHVVWDDANGIPTNPGDVQVAFDLPTGRRIIDASAVYVHPNYTGDAIAGADIAIIQLATPAVGASGYDIYRGRDEVGKTITFYGYGLAGTGTSGTTIMDGLKRVGYNRIEATGTVLGGPDSMLVMDFDGGTDATDALGLNFEIHDLGLGIDESDTAPGDSGGPMFIDGKIAGVESFGTTADCTFGDIDVKTRVSSFVNWIDSILLSSPREFLVNANVPELDDTGAPVTDPDTGEVVIAVDNQSLDQKWSSVAMDADGDYVITWTSYGHDGVGNGYGAGLNGTNGVFARRFDLTGIGDSFQVNDYAAGDQQHSSVSLDADGDFVIAWESFQDRPATGSSDPNSYGIFAKRYAGGQKVGVDPLLGANGEIGGEFAVNSYKDGDQRFPSVALDDTGNTVIVYSGAGATDPQGIYQQRLVKQKDDAGPRITEVADISDGTWKPLTAGAALGSTLTTIAIDFSENLDRNNVPEWEHNVLNLANWSLLKDGSEVSGITSVSFGYNPLRGKYEAVIGLDGDATLDGIQPLGAGAYTLVAKPAIQDLFKNGLDGDGDGKVGGQLYFSVVVSSGTSGAPSGITNPTAPPKDARDATVNVDQRFVQDNPAVATDSSGNYVIAWVTRVSTIDSDIWAQRFDRYGVAQGAAFRVNSYTTGIQIEPDVTMDAYGNFIIVWSGPGADDASGVFARRYDAFGVAQGEQFMLNQYKANLQNMPRVAMDPQGDFVVAWTSYGQDKDKDGIYARRYNYSGQPVSNEFRVNTRWKNRQQKPDVAMDANGNFIVIWASDQQDGSGWGVYGQRYLANGKKTGSEFRLNSFTKDRQIDARVAMDAKGNFIATWATFHTTANGFDVYSRRFSNKGKALDKKDVLVTQTTKQWQISPDVGMDASGNYYVTWTTFDQDNREVDDLIHHDNGVYARKFRFSDGKPDSAYPNEFRVNATVLGEQRSSVIGVSPSGDVVVAWVGPDSDGTGIYDRIVTTNPGSYELSTGPSGMYSRTFAGLVSRTATSPSVATQPTISVAAASVALAAQTPAEVVQQPLATSPTGGTVSASGATSSLTGSRALLSAALAAWNVESNSDQAASLVGPVAQSPGRTTLSSFAAAVDRLMTTRK